MKGHSGKGVRIKESANLKKLIEDRIQMLFTPLKDNEFKCDQCGCVFLKSVSDQEAWDKAKKEFPNLTSQTAAVVCHDCYNKIMN